MESYSKACCDNGGALGIKNSLDSCNQTNRGHPNSGSCDCKGSVQGVDVDSGLPQSSHSFHTLSFARSTSETNKKKSNYPQQGICTFVVLELLKICFPHRALIGTGNNTK